MKIKKPHVLIRILLGIISLALCIALFATTLVAIVISDVRVLTNKDNLQTFISQVLFATPKKNAPIILRQGVGVGGVRLDEPESGLTSTQQMVVDYVFDMLKDEFGEELPITQDEVEDLLEQSTLPDFISEKMASIISDIYTGENTTTITKEEVLTLMEENVGLIEEAFNIEITQEQLDEVVQWVDEIDIVGTVQDVVQGELNLGGPADPDAPPAEGETGEADSESGDNGSASTGTPNSNNKKHDNIIEGIIAGDVTVDSIVNGGIPTMLAAIREVTSMNMLLTVLGACGVLILLLFLTNYWKPYAAVRSAGIVAMLADLPFFVATVMVMATPAMFTGDPALSVVALIIELTSTVSIGVFAGGFALLVISIVWGCLAKSRARKLAAAAVAQPVAVQIPVVQVPVEPVHVVEETPVAEEAPAAEEVPVAEETVEEPETNEEEPQEV